MVVIALPAVVVLSGASKQFDRYILIAIRWEERDLLAAFGETYADYRQRVRMFVPRLF
jgi:protein-S-isoprenylcysteine O-methyltransferase Ste14